jgi:hypothetical protein
MGLVRTGLVQTLARGAAGRSGRLLAVAAVAMALSACSKCDMPVWHHDTLPNPQSCHDDSTAK